MSVLRFAGVLLLLPLIAAVAGCGGAAPPPGSASPDRGAQADSSGGGGGGGGGTLRIVSLTPGITRMLVDLGLGDRLVGVAEFDDAVPEGMNPPVLGHFLDVDMEKLAIADPTHILMMVGKEGAPANLVSLAESKGIELVVYPYPKTVADVARMLHDPDDELEPISVGEAVGRPGRAAALRRTLMGGLDAIAAVTARAGDRPRTLMVIGEGVPVMALGPGGPMHELLHIAGGTNAAAGGTNENVPAPTFDREKLAALDPEVIVLMLPKSPPLGDVATDARLATFRGLPVPAVDRGEIHLMNDPEVLLPSTRMLDTAAGLARLLHPGLAGAIDAAVAEAATEVPSGP